MTTNARKPLPMTPQQLADARAKVDLKDATVVLKFFGEGSDRLDHLEGVWSVFAYAPSLEEPTELVALFDEEFESFAEAREIAYALSDNLDCEVVVIEADEDSNVLQPGERPTWMEFDR